AIIPLMRYTHDRTLMGEYVDGPVKHVVNIAVAALIVALNVVLIVLTMLGKA
ncbi:MAG: divalent metal cation transporter, partial [Bifidobacterium adolescentis]